MNHPTGSFDRCAARYEELRPVDDYWYELFDLLVRVGGLRGARVLEVGCGTGRLAHELQERALARVWALDTSAAMVEQADALGVNARVARAEALPFKQGWFDAVTMRMMLHLTDRPRALAEASRVLAPDGRIVIATEDPESFDTVWFTPFFPSVPSLERSRFPGEAELRQELAAVGFPNLTVERLRQARTLTREGALEILRARAYSTFDLLPPDEYTSGLAQAERELPALIAYDFDWLVVAATR